MAQPSIGVRRLGRRQDLGRSFQLAIRGADIEPAAIDDLRDQRAIFLTMSRTEPEIRQWQAKAEVQAEEIDRLRRLLAESESTVADLSEELTRLEDALSAARSGLTFNEAMRSLMNAVEHGRILWHEESQSPTWLPNGTPLRGTFSTRELRALLYFAPPDD